MQILNAQSQSTATDSAGASGEATVTIKITNVDEKPEFTTEAATAASPMTIMSPEKSTALWDATRPTEDFVTTEAGVTYAAMDEDGVNLRWSLRGADGAKLQLSGSRVLSFKAKPDYEMPTDTNKDNVYMVTVRASDGTKYADRMVKVTVTDVNEGPEITGKDRVNYAENGEDPVATFTAEDPEGVTPIHWSVPTDLSADEIDGIVDADDADNGDFTIDKDGVLKFNIEDTNDGSSPGSPDFENGQGSVTGETNTYKVVVVASDLETGGVRGYHKVTVKVTEVAETGKVTWTVSPDGTLTPGDVNGASPIVQFQVGAVLTVAGEGGVTDGDVPDADKDVTETLQWYRSSSEIDGETSNTYTVTTEDIGKYIRVVASYNIGTGPTVDASRTSDYPVVSSRTNNKAPEFDDEITREVSEGKKGMTVGAPVRATDDITNRLSYSLGGADEVRFKIDEKTGQITTAVDLDREGTAVATATTLGSCADASETDADPECTVTVTATDSAGASGEADRHHQDYERGREAGVHYRGGDRSVTDDNNEPREEYRSVGCY